MTKLEQAAVTYIETRRAKLTAKAARNSLLDLCEGRENGNACVTHAEKSEWCEGCVQSKPYDEEFKRQSVKTTIAVRRLETEVGRL